MPDDIELKDVTDEVACFGLFGPKSIDLLQRLTKDDISNEKIKFASFKKIQIR